MAHQADYLIVGAGAVGMIFADQLLSETGATIAIVDRQATPGGHWNEAYPFVRLHQPSAYYGVNSRVLGTNRIDETGPNAGFYERATASEIWRSRKLRGGCRPRFVPMTRSDAMAAKSS